MSYFKSKYSGSPISGGIGIPPSRLPKPLARIELKIFRPYFKIRLLIIDFIEFKMIFIVF